MGHESIILRVKLRQGTDLTGPRPVPFPEVLISGNEEGLELLRGQIAKVLEWSCADPTAHTHITGRDGPGFETTPDGLMLTIECIRDDTSA